MKIIFIRHGETTGDIEDRFGGDYDDHLSEKGVAQAKQVAELLKNRNMGVIYSSVLVRAKETAGVIARPWNIVHWTKH
jgi:broad specificity phosphatase PhoE